MFTSTISLWPVARHAYGARGVHIISRPLGGREYVVSDHLGSVRAVVSDMSAILERKDYKPFGSALTTAGTGARTGYIDREEDGESGLGSCGVRLYEPEYGRFTSVDVLWEEYGAFQPYHYSFNSPLVLSDNTGLGPGDEYKSAREAAYNWANNYAGESIARGIEMGSIIYSKKNDNGETVFAYTLPTYGDEGSVRIDMLIPVGSVEVANIHAHGKYRKTNSEGSNVEPNKISGSEPGYYGGDAEYVRLHQSDGYVTTPNGSMLYLDHVTMKTSTISTDLPSDPKDPTRKNRISPNTKQVQPGIPGTSVERAREDI